VSAGDNRRGAAGQDPTNRELKVLIATITVFAIRGFQASLLALAATRTKLKPAVDRRGFEHA
jgi:hypothetical protein